MELEAFLPFNFLMAFQTVLAEVLEFKLEQNCLQQVSFSILHSVASFRSKLFVFKNVFRCGLPKNKTLHFFFFL